MQIMRFFRVLLAGGPKAYAKRERVERLFQSFVAETKPLVPKAPKHPEAALFRHAWKRSIALAEIHERKGGEEQIRLYREFRVLAAKQYFAHAPSTLYGKPKLEIGPSAYERLLAAESRRLSSRGGRRKKTGRLACVYLGRCEAGRIYVGQTKETPERRWAQHREDGTGPFKTGAKYVKWEIVEGDISERKLDELESYYIGIYDALENGHNENHGNDWEAYRRGCSDREDTVRLMKP